MTMKPAVFRAESTGSLNDLSKAVDAAVARALHEEPATETGDGPVLSGFTPSGEGSHETDSSDSTGYGWGV